MVDCFQSDFQLGVLSKNWLIMNNLSELLKKKLIFVSGKGGSGKTTVSGVLGLLLQCQGRKVLLAEANPFCRLPDLFCKYPEHDHHEVTVNSRLSIVNLNSEYCFKEYIYTHLGKKRIYELLFKNKVTESFLNAVPGLNEIMVLGRLIYALKRREDPFDVVVFDAPSFGHFYNLLNSPQSILNTGMVGPLVKEIAEINQCISDETFSTGLVTTTPEELIFLETVDFLKKIKKNDFSLHTGGVIINKMVSENEFKKCMQSQELDLIAKDHSSEVKFFREELNKRFQKITQMKKELKKSWPELAVYDFFDSGRVVLPLTETQAELISGRGQL